MDITLALIFNPLVYTITLLITGTSAFYVARQATTEYGQLKSLLILVHVFFISIVLLEFVRNFYQTAFFMNIYTVSNTTFVLVDVILLTLVALAIYLRPQGRGLREILLDLPNHRIHLVLFTLFCGYILTADGMLLAYRPYSVNTLTNVAGFEVKTTAFEPGYLMVLGGVLLVFILYPSAMLLSARRRTEDPGVRRALLGLPIAWTGIGLDMILFEGYLPTPPFSIDASAIGYLVAASSFSVTAAVFRRATVLTGFFGPLQIGPEEQHEMAVRLIGEGAGLDLSRVMGRTVLLEVDPSSTFEHVLRGLALQSAAEGYVVFAFVSRGSPTFLSLADLQSVRFYIFSDRISYPRPGPRANEMMVPRNDHPVLLSVLDKTLSANPQLRIVVVFDNITDLILSSNFEQSYKFLKQAIQMADAWKVTALFTVVPSTHTDSEVNLIRSLFSNQVQLDPEGVHVSKLQ